MARRPPLPQSLAELAHAKAEARAKEERATRSEFELFRAAFLQHYRDDIFKGLQAVLGKSVEVSQTHLSLAVELRFMKAVLKLHSGSVSPTFHGTNHGNFNSIFKRGLLIPGQGNELQVVNGSAHGKGIYTANLNAPWLSKCFCSAPTMLVCAVLQSSSVRHVMDAQVVFNAAHVVPLFQGAAKAFHVVTPALLSRPKPVSVARLLDDKPSPQTDTTADPHHL